MIALLVPMRPSEEIPEALLFEARAVAVDDVPGRRVVGDDLVEALFLRRRAADILAAGFNRTAGGQMSHRNAQKLARDRAFLRTKYCDVAACRREE